MLRNVGWFNADTLLNVTHRQITGRAEDFQDPNTHGVRERPEEFSLEVLERLRHPAV